MNGGKNVNAYIDISDTVIKTERLTLRPWKNSDLDDFFEYASVPGVGEAAGWPHHKTKEESKNILDISTMLDTFHVDKSIFNL